MTSAYALL